MKINFGQLARETRLSDSLLVQKKQISVCKIIPCAAFSQLRNEYPSSHYDGEYLPAGITILFS